MSLSPIGIHMDALTEIESIINKAFATTAALYWATHSYHWNVTGPQFPALHELLEEQYKDLWESLDGIAERLRSLGMPAPHSLAAQTALTHSASAGDMLADLTARHEAAAAQLRAAIDQLTGLGDTATADYFTDLLASHEKMAWMLRSSK